MSDDALEQRTHDLADNIAARLLEEYEIGTSSRFMDEPAYFEHVEQDDIATLIREVINAAR